MKGLGVSKALAKILNFKGTPAEHRAKKRKYARHWTKARSAYAHEEAFGP